MVKEEQLNTQQITEFTKLVCACGSMQDQISRDQIVRSLGDAVMNCVIRGRSLRTDVYNIIDTCNRLACVVSLLEVLKQYEDNTVQWREIQDWLTKQPQAIGVTEKTFRIPFKNRVLEKDAILNILQIRPRIQIQGMRGWGKTYLLDELRKIFDAQGWITIWIDLDIEKDRQLRSNKVAFLREFTTRLLHKEFPDIYEMEERDFLDWLGRQIANKRGVAVLIDNIDRSDRTLSFWLGKVFAHAIDKWAPSTYIITAGQQLIPEWKSVQIQRPFISFPLHLIDDVSIVNQIVDHVIKHHGFPVAKEWRYKENWNDELDRISSDIIRLTKGHLLLIERVLEYAVHTNGFMRTTYFSENSSEIYRRCISPAINERILRDLDRDESQAFRQLCVFRYITPGILSRLIDDRYPEIAEDITTHIFSDQSTAMSGWTRFQKTGLLSDVQERGLYPLSNVVRRVVQCVLSAENRELYQERNRRARYEYELLLQNNTNSSLDMDDKLRSTKQRCAYVIEICYHLAYDESLDSISIQERLFNEFSLLLRSLTGLLALVIPEILNWLRLDDELNDIITQRAGSDFYERLLKLVECANDNSTE